MRRSQLLLPLCIIAAAVVVSVADYAPDPGFCRMVKQCGGCDADTKVSTTTKIPVTDTGSSSTDKSDTETSTTTSNTTDDKSTTALKTDPGTTSTTTRPTPNTPDPVPTRRPNSCTGLVEDDNGPKRCRVVSGQQPGSGQIPISSSPKCSDSGTVPGTYHGRIPCSSASKQKPCLAELIRSWDYQRLEWSEPSYPRSGWPEPWVLPSEAYTDGDVVLEIVDWQWQTSHYTITVDGRVVDETDEEGYQNEEIECETPEMCIDKGYGRAFAFVPKSSSSVVVKNTAGLKVFNSGYEHEFEHLAWRLWKPCVC